MFRDEYIKAYDNISPNEDSIDKIFHRVQEAKTSEPKTAGFAKYVPIAAAFLAICFCSVLVLPVAAMNIPVVYDIVAKYAPALVDYILPEEVSSTSQGITMQVEAVNIVDNEAEIIISFKDAGETNYISGKLDLYDSYYLKNYSANWQAGGCSFLEYDEKTQKAYFKIGLTAANPYGRERVTFGVRQMLTRHIKEEQVIDMSDILSNPPEKKVHLNGSGGMTDKSEIPFLIEAFAIAADDPRPGARVMDIHIDESMLEELVVTGVAYDEGVLRLQVCRGNFSNADRHVRPYLVDSYGNERVNDYSVMWHEEINGEKILVDEYWF